MIKETFLKILSQDKFEFLFTGAPRSYWCPCILLMHYNDEKVLIEYFDEIKKDFIKRIIDQSLLTKIN